MKTDTLPLTRFLFLNILSILHNLAPTTLYFHVTTQPYGFFWNLTRVFDVQHRIVVAKISPQMYLLQGQHTTPLLRPDWADAHQSDIIRMNILKSSGGIYLDTDVLVLRSFDGLRNFDMTMGLQTSNKICNGVILANPNSRFLTEWYSGMYNANFSNCWDCHSIELPSRLWKEWTKNKQSTDTRGKMHISNREVNILPLESFYDPSFSRSDLHELFREPHTVAKKHRLTAPYDGKYAVHLWNRVRTASNYLSSHRVDDICQAKSMYNEMLRYALNGSAFLTQLCENA